MPREVPEMRPPNPWIFVGEVVGVTAISLLGNLIDGTPPWLTGWLPAVVATVAIWLAYKSSVRSYENAREAKRIFEATPAAMAAMALAKITIRVGMALVPASDLFLLASGHYGEKAPEGLVGSFIERNYGLKYKEGEVPDSQLRSQLLSLGLIEPVPGTEEPEEGPVYLITKYRLRALGEETLAVLRATKAVPERVASW